MNWKEAIAELIRLGMKQPQIAEECGCSQATVSMLANGKILDPRDSIGQAVRRLLEAKRREAAEKAVPPAAPAHGAEAAVQAPG